MSTEKDDAIDSVLISNEVIRLNDKILDFSDAVSFLKEPNLNKDNVMRMLSWLIVLKIIPDTSVESSVAVANMYRAYRMIIKKKLEGAEDPLEKINVKESRVIIADINRSLYWFDSLAKSINLEEYYTQEVRAHTIRILSLLSLSSKVLSYLQGFDRYVLVSYLLGLIFISKSGLPTTVAEAISYFLSLNLLKMSRPDKLLVDNDKTVQHFQELDSKIAIYAPDVYEKMSSNEVSSLLFALRWQLLIFADEHDLKGLLYIWDNAIVNRAQYSNYLESLSISHICQIPEDSQGNLVEVIQHYRKWDNVEIVRKADSLLSEIESSKHYRIGVLNYVLFFLILAVIIYYLYRVFNLNE
ncbi:hypothetical protein M9Y10_023076 [Tritrichomonas musculus]|uniref:Rab-GAP TBC domain-containing protein n=1 Tax=Tritrichomonas musculus TaxID=1915356 RepID=A0ABR2KU49_9EUKA